MIKNYTHNVFTFLLWVGYITIAGVIIWGLNKGFDLTDEGFVALSMTPGQEDFFKLWPSFAILTKITSVVKPGIIFWRSIRLVLLILSSFLFCFGLIKWLQATIETRDIISMNFLYPITGIGSLMSYSVYPQGLSYNVLTLIFVEIIIGLFLIHISSKQPKRGKQTILTLFLIGFFIGGLFTIKFSSALLLIMMLSLFFFFAGLYQKHSTFNEVMKNYLIIITGLFAAMGLVYVLYASPLTIISNIIHAHEFDSAHDSSEVITNYLNDLGYNFFLFFFKYVSIIITGPLVLWILLRYSFKKMFMIAKLYIIYNIKNIVFKHEYHKSGLEHIYSASGLYRMLILFFLILFLLVIIDKRTRKMFLPFIKNPAYFFIGLLAFLAMPFICSFGTNNAFSVHITQFICAWVLIISIAILILSYLENYTYFLLPIALSLIMVNVSSQIINGFVDHPYNQNQPLTEQKYSIPQLPVEKNILFDKETKLFINTLLNKLERNNITVNNQPIAVFDYPGLTYLLGGHTPGAPWYSGCGYENISKTICAMFTSSKMNGLDKTIFISGNWCPIPDEFINCIRDKGVFFRENYYIVDSIEVPDNIVAGDVKENGKLYIYAPK